MSKKIAGSYMLSCDWGTTSFRLRLVNLQSNDINVRYTVTSSEGIKTLDRSQPGDIFQTYLASQITYIEKQISQNLDHIPVIISGMTSSSIGWKELPYGTLPFSLNNPPLPVKHIPRTSIFPHDVLLISGICSSDDVMRGEEIQVIGLANQYDLKNAVCILPGTHSKHIFINKNKITGFKTYMTGEFFELIRTQSILKESVHSSEKQFREIPFRKGVMKALHTELMHNLFSIRANDLLHQSNHTDNFNFLSGLLIGAELKALKSLPAKKIYLAASDALKHRYISALDLLKMEVHSIKNISNLTIQGHRFMLSHINPKKTNS